jgi:hypothetical protein
MNWILQELSKIVHAQNAQTDAKNPNHTTTQKQQKGEKSIICGAIEGLNKLDTLQVGGAWMKCHLQEM